MAPFPIFQDAEEQVGIKKSFPRRMLSQNSSLSSRTPLGKRTNAKQQGSAVADGNRSKEKGGSAGRSAAAVLEKENGASSLKQQKSQQQSLTSFVKTTPPHAAIACRTQQRLQESSSLRQSVRESLRRQTKSPGSSTATSTAQLKKHPVSLRPSRIPTPATTPRSLLSSEMKLASVSTTHSQNGAAAFDDEDEELMLCSPAPRRVLGQRRLVVRASLGELPVQNPKSHVNAARKINTADISSHGKPHSLGSTEAKGNVVPQKTNTSATGKSFSLQESTTTMKPKTKTSCMEERVHAHPLPAPLDAKPAPSMQTNGKLSKTMSSDAKICTISTESEGEAGSRESQLLTLKPPQTIPKPPKLSIAREPALDPSTQAPLMSTRSQWSQRLPASAFRVSQQQNHQQQQTPFTPAVPKNFPATSSKKSGVCMDLTDMFCNAAASSSGGGPIRPPPSVARQQKTPMSAISACNRTVPAPTATSCAHESDDWAEKQCESITKWLNYTFHPTEDKDHSDDGARNNDQQVETKPEEERLALRTLVLHQRLAQARLKGYQVFHSDKMQSIRNVILSEIQRGRISVRQDRDMYADLTMRRQIVQLLFSYSTPWLRLGLETLFGEIILPEEAAQQNSSSPSLPSKHMNRKSGKVRILSLECFDCRFIHCSLKYLFSNHNISYL